MAEPDVVGVIEIAQRLGVTRQAVHVWRRRHADFPEPALTVSGLPAWQWPDVQTWAEATGRLPHER